MRIIAFFSKQRVFTATIFIAITLAACILGGWLWCLFIVVLAVVGIDELIKLVNVKGIYPDKGLIYFFSIMFVVLASLKMPDYFIHVVVFAFIIVFVRFLFKNGKVSINDIFATVFTILYAGLLPVYFILIRNLSYEDWALPGHFVEPGASYLILILMTIFASDIGAYYTGTKLGKHPLCPTISPKKTIEGAIGGTISGILMAMLIGMILELNMLHNFLLGIIIVIAAQLGDLCESLIKRDIGVKDSGDIVPGHGGILDRADSYIFTAAASYYYIKWVVLNGVF